MFKIGLLKRNGTLKHAHVNVLTLKKIYLQGIQDFIKKTNLLILIEGFIKKTSLLILIEDFINIKNKKNESKEKLYVRQ